jgi:hypothetical protein
MKRYDYVLLHKNEEFNHLEVENKYDLAKDTCPYLCIPQVQEIALTEIQEYVPDMTMEEVLDGEGCPLVSPTENMCLECWSADIDSDYGWQ